MSRSESQAETRRHLCDAAQELFERQGFHRTTVGEIAETAGYSTGAIYSNFPRKEDVAIAVLDRSLRTNVESLVSEISRHDDFAERLIAVIRWRRDLLTQSEPMGILRLELWLYSMRDPDLRETLIAGQQVIHAAFARMLQKQAEDLGATLLVDPVLLASALLAIADGTAIANGLEPTGEHAKAFAWALAALMVSSLDPSPIPPSDWTPFLNRLLDAADAGEPELLPPQ